MHWQIHNGTHRWQNVIVRDARVWIFPLFMTPSQHSPTEVWCLRADDNYHGSCYMACDIWLISIVLMNELKMDICHSAPSKFSINVVFIDYKWSNKLKWYFVIRELLAIRDGLLTLAGAASDDIEFTIDYLCCYWFVCFHPLNVSLNWLYVCWLYFQNLILCCK